MVKIGDFHITSNVSNVTDYADLLNEYIYIEFTIWCGFWKHTDQVIQPVVETLPPPEHLLLFLFFFFSFCFFFFFSFFFRFCLKLQLVFIKVKKDYKKKTKKTTDVKLVQVDFNEWGVSVHAWKQICNLFCIISQARRWSHLITNGWSSTEAGE